jgi:LmbE family N-acetylglucosaminyl deacetylase
LRTWAARVLRQYLLSRSAPLAPHELREPTLVFAPHPDDETLGCGGTIAKRREAGARVQVAFLTDGSASHVRHMTRSALARARQHEAEGAARELGLHEGDLHFLGFPDGELHRHGESAAARVRALLRREQPRAVYVPHLGDGPSDHRTTSELVLDGLRAMGLRATVFEYPVWLWHSFPWVRLDTSRGLRRALANSACSQLALLRGERCVVPLGPARTVKLRALRCYESQMSAPPGMTNWPTLGDVAGGDFLAALLTDHEIFHRREVGSDS